MRGPRRTFPQPLWLGAEDIAGKTIFLHAEQGLGDTLQFGRYVPHLVARGARVILEVQTPLRSLMASLPGNPQIVAGGDRLPDFDLHCPLLSLPLAFHTRLDTIPGATPYLSAPPDKVTPGATGSAHAPSREWVWSGPAIRERNCRTLNRIDSQRSIAFAALAPLLDVAACSFYSLQKGDDAVKQLRDSAWRDRVIDFTDDLHDFSDTAALIENLDLVISVDTSVLHVAGALAKPVWLLNRHNTCWRWLRGREKLAVVSDRSSVPAGPDARLGSRYCPRSGRVGRLCFRFLDRRSDADGLAQSRCAVPELIELVRAADIVAAHSP